MRHRGMGTVSFMGLLVGGAVCSGCGSDGAAGKASSRARLDEMLDGMVADTGEGSTIGDAGDESGETLAVTGPSCDLLLDDGDPTTNPDGSVSLRGSLTAIPYAPYASTGEENTPLVVTIDGTFDAARQTFTFTATGDGLPFWGTAPANGDPIDESLVNVDAFFTVAPDGTVGLVENPHHAWIGDCGSWNAVSMTAYEVPPPAKDAPACQESAEKYPIGVEMWKVSKQNEDKADFWQDAIAIGGAVIELTPAKWLGKLPLALKSVRNTKIAVGILTAAGWKAEDKKLEDARTITARLQEEIVSYCKTWRLCCSVLAASDPSKDKVNCENGKPKPECSTDWKVWAAK